MAVKDWSTTAADNDDADSTINWLEGQAPSTVNDSARAMMAALKSWYNLIDAGTISNGTVGGTANAITLTCSPTVSALAAGQRYLFKYTSTGNTGGVTLNVDGLGAAAIQFKGAALVSGDIATNDWVLVTHDGSVFQMLSETRVSSRAVLDGSVTTAKIADNAVTTAKLLDLNVTTGKIADGAVTAGKIASDAVTTVKILDLNVTTGKIADGAVTAAKLAANQGICKVAVEWGGDTAGANKTLYQSLNVSTVADNGTGDFTVNFTTSFAASAYSGGHLCGFNTGGTIMSIKGYNDNTTKTASAYRVITSTGSSAADQSVSGLVLFGPQ